MKKHNTNLGPMLGLELLGLAVLLVLSGCATRPSATLGGMPAPPDGAQSVADDQLVVSRTAMAETARTSMNVSDVQYNVYVLPADEAFDSVRSYYQGLLPDGWTEQETEKVQEARDQGLEAVIWSNRNQDEFLSIQYTPVPKLGGNMLIVMYAQR